MNDMNRHASALIVLGASIVLPLAVAAGPIDTLQPGRWYEVPKSGAITTVQLVNTAATSQSGVVGTFGHIFKQGDVPAGSTLLAQDSDGSPVTLQVDKKATHADGSLRHAILTARLAALGASATRTITLFAQADGAPQPPVSLADLLNGTFDSRVSLNVSGVVYTASARTLLETTVPKSWLSGPEVSEWIVGGPVKDGGGNPHAHLAAYFHVRAYAGSPINRVRVDVSIENGWSYVAAGSNYTYNATVAVGGANVYTRNSLEHFHHARWHQVFWWGTSPQIDIVHAKAYLMLSKAVPNYNTAILPSEEHLASLTTSIVPMGLGDHRSGMPQGGIDQTIGPLPGWAAAYLVTNDKRARDSMFANADAGGSFSIHYRDDGSHGGAKVGYPTSIIEHPSGGMPEQSGGDYADTISPNVVPYVPDTAHQPSVAYLPYLISGDYYYLEEMQFWVIYNFINGEQSVVNARAYEKGYVRGHQERGQAWALRELGRAAFVTPDLHPLKTDLTTWLDNNRVWYTLAYVDGGVGDFRNNFGAIDRGDLGTNSGRQETKTWMDDYFTWSVGQLLELGYSDWRRMLDFKARFVLGRLNSAEFCYIVSGRDTVPLAATAQGTWYANWTQVYNAGFPTLSGVACASQLMADILSTWGEGPKLQGEIYGWATLPGSRVGSMHAAASVLVDNGIAGAQGAWANLRSSTVLPNWQDYINGGTVFAIWPRSADMIFKDGF